MVKQKDAALDEIFAALSHAARRRTLEALGQGMATVSDLAASHDMSLPGFMKHVRVLEDAGLIACSKVGRTVSCSARPHKLDQASAWLASREQMWESRLDALGRHLYHQSEVKPPKKSPR